VVVWEHHGRGAIRIGPAVADKTQLRPRILHIGVREGHVYRLMIDGPWTVRFDSEADDTIEFALQHGIPTRKCYRCIGDAVEEGNTHTAEDDLSLFDTPNEIADALEARQQQLTAPKLVKAAGAQVWFYGGDQGLRYLALQLHARGITCEATLSTYTTWKQLRFPALKVSVRCWSSTAMGGLHPDDLSDDSVAAKLSILFEQKLYKLKKQALDFRVVSQYSPSVQSVLERFWRGPIVGAESAVGVGYTKHDWQCDINGAHPAAMLAMTEIPAFGHFDRVQEYDQHPIEAHSMYIVELVHEDRIDAFLNADVTPVLGSSYLKYLQLAGSYAVPHSISHCVRPSRIIRNCHIPAVVQALLDDEELGSPALDDYTKAQKFKKGLLVTLSGLMQQRHSDRISAVIITDAKEAQAAGGRTVPVSADMEGMIAEMRGRGQVRGHVKGQDTHVCMKWRRSVYKDGFYALAMFILDYTRLRVLEIRNALESCGATDFAYQCDAVFYKGRYMEDTARARYPALFGTYTDAQGGSAAVPGTAKFKPAHYGQGERTFTGMQLKQSCAALPLDLRHIEAPSRPAVVVEPLWQGLGESFPSLQAAEEEWRKLNMRSKTRLWSTICDSESPQHLQERLQNLLNSSTGQRMTVAVTGQHGGAGKSYCTFRAATNLFATGMVLTPTNSLRTAYPQLPDGWTVRTYDRQLGFFVGDEQRVQKSGGSLGLPDVSIVILEEVAYVQTRTLSMILAAAEHRGMHVIATYDMHQLDPIADTSGAHSVDADNEARLTILQRAFPLSFHIFARKRDPTKREQIVMDDHLLYILAAATDAEAKQRTMERFGCKDLPSRGAAKFHLAYTRECARYYAFQEMASLGHRSNLFTAGACVLAGKYHKFCGRAGIIHKNHLYSVMKVTGDAVTVSSDFDAGESLPRIDVPVALAELLLDPPGASTVHSVQGRTVKGSLLVHQVLHANVTKKWLYTAISRGCGPKNIYAINDYHRSVSNMSLADKERWAQQKAASYVRWDALNSKTPSNTAQELAAILLHNDSEATCDSCSKSLVWARYSEHQPTLDRLDNSLGHVTTNLVRNCLRCNRERGSRSLKRKRE
jgi:hypothetical protein